MTDNRSVVLQNNNFLFTKHTDQRKWEGACLDNKTETKVIRLKQGNEYCNFVGIKFVLNVGTDQYRFRNDRLKSVGSVTI